MGAAITALPPAFRRLATRRRRRAWHRLIERLDTLAAWPGHQLVYSLGRELGERERPR
jgi:hypothetical protein